MNRKLKKYYLKYEYLKLEDEDTGAELADYIKDFEDRFNKYYHRPVKEVWVNEETGEVRDDHPPFDEFKKHWEDYKKQEEDREEERKARIVDLKNRPDKLKKLYKKLASYVHPDRGGSNELFQQVNKAYESNNLMALLNFAGEYDLEYEIDNSDERTLEKNLKELEREIERKKGTLAWAWGAGDKNTRKYVITEIERQTGQSIDETDLPEDLVDKPEEILLISTGSLVD